jgi:hypothetical protein
LIEHGIGILYSNSGIAVRFQPSAIG